MYLPDPDEKAKHDEVDKLADTFSDTIRTYTGASSAIIFYGYYRDGEWRYGSAGKGDLLQRIGLCDLIKNDLLIKPDEKY